MSEPIKVPLSFRIGYLMSDGLRGRPGLALATLYGGAVALRNALYDWRLLPVADPGLPAISVGNLTAGGSGKTPLVLHLARALLGDQVPVGLLSRGYGRRERGPRLILPGEPLPGPGVIGDEPWLLRTRLPQLALAIDARRARGARLLAPHLVGGCFLLDDGFQHRALARTMDVVVVATGEPLAAARLLPHGRMREPASSIRRASHVVLIDSPPGASPEQMITLRRELSRLAPGVPVARARPMLQGFRPLGEPGSALLPAVALPKPVLALAGIARPERFAATLAAADVPVAMEFFLPDHQEYDGFEGALFGSTAVAVGAAAIVTTEKDEPRLLAAGGKELLGPLSGVRGGHGSRLRRRRSRAPRCRRVRARQAAHAPGGNGERMSRRSGAPDFLVIGSGIAGLTTALECAAAGEVAIITKKEDRESNTNYAQGGLAAVMGKSDRFALHIRDTLRAGVGLCHRDAVELIVEDGPARVRELARIGVRFSREGRELELGREGGIRAGGSSMPPT